jgi:hypothetical protein
MTDMKSFVFWDIMRCCQLKAYRRFEGICHPHLQGQRISHARNQHETGSKQTVNGLHGLVSRKTKLFIPTAEGTVIPR